MNNDQQYVLQLVMDRADGKITSDKFQEELSKLRKKYDGITPPASFGTVRLPGSFKPDLAQDYPR